MNFTSYEFVLFFALVLVAKGCLRNFSSQKWLLLAASCLFYLTWNVPCLLLILFTAVSDYAIVRKISRTSEPGARHRLLLVSLVCNLGLLAFFKYANFFLENASALLSAVGVHVNPWHVNIILPPAISFYTFASLSYVLDVYYERMPACESLRDYALFITFFSKTACPGRLCGRVSCCRSSAPACRNFRRRMSKSG